MMNKIEEYYIYKAENEKNNLIYVGSTTRSVEERKKDHIQKANKATGHQFHEAIATYGQEAFTWEQIDTASSMDELAKKEKEYILEYNSKEDGYNTDAGGGFKKTVYKYDLDAGELVAVFETLTEAALTVNSIKQSISRACLNVNNTYRGFYWSYDLVTKFTPNKDKRRKEVAQFAFDGTLIDKFKSVTEASKQTGINKSSIAKCCRGLQKSSGDYIWKYRI